MCVRGVCICVCVPVCLCVCEDQRLTLDIIPLEADPFLS